MTARTRTSAFSEGVVVGYIHGGAVGFPLFTVVMLAWAAKGHAQTGLALATAGAIGTWLSWHLVRVHRRNRRR